jgi:phosphoribosylglycinamide formyltransferase 2
MDREGIRKLVSEELQILTSDYRFASNIIEFRKSISDIGIPCVVKPVMSSSGKGQSIIKNKSQIEDAWEHALAGARGKSKKVIIESFIDFDYEITLLTIQHKFGCSFCLPIGHRQENGDYQESWQPHPMLSKTLKEAERVAEIVTSELGGYGLFGVEFFIKDDQVYFSELSPRPHDTGMVTLISQDLSEFALHARAILGLPIPNIRFYSPASSSVILIQGNSSNVKFNLSEAVLQEEDTQIRLFGKPSVNGERRMGVALALGDDIDNARNKAKNISNSIKYVL